MKIIDNFLPNDIHQQFVDLLMSNDFPYYFIDGVANINGTEDDFIFFHNLYGNPHNFNHLGIIKIDKNEISDERIFELAIQAGADECKSNNYFHEIHCSTGEIYNVKK